MNPVTGEVISVLKHTAIYPASHYIIPKEKLEIAIDNVEKELAERVKYFEDKGKLLEAERIQQRVNYDIEMLREIGFCRGIENYSRVLLGRPAGSAPYTLLDYFLHKQFPSHLEVLPCR